MALTTITLQPNSTLQSGSPLWSVVGAASGSAALSDGSDSTYVQITAGVCRLDSQVMRVGFPAPTIPAGAQILSVGLRRRVQTVVAGNDVPLCYHWLRTIFGIVDVVGQLERPVKAFYNSPCPTSPTTATWTTETIGTFTTGPGGQPWTVDTLTGLTYDLGRGDSSTTSPLRVSEVYLDITYQQQSSVTVTSPAGVAPDTRPTVQWTYSSPDSQPQQAYQVAVYTLAQTLADGFVPFTTTPLQGTSGYVLGEDLQWTLTSDLTDGQYVAYVQAQSRWAGSGTFATTISSISWTRSVTSVVTVSNPPLVAVLSSVEFDPTANRVGVTFGPGTAPTAATISAVGTLASATGTGLTTLSVTPTAAGDVLVLATRVDSASNSIASVSGGGVTKWQRVISPFVGSSKTLGMWMGVVATTGSSTITITGQSALTSTNVVLSAQQFTSTAGSATVWMVEEAANGQVNNTASTTVTFPTITPAGSGGRAYIGYGTVANAGLTTGQTSGYTVELSAANGPFIYNPNVSGTQSPVAAQNTAGTSVTIGLILTTVSPATTAFTVQASRDGGVTWLQPDGSPSIPSLTLVPAQGTSSITAYDQVANLNVASQYRVLAYSGPPYVAATAPSNVLSATPVDTRFWLKDPNNPLLNTPLPVAAPKQSDAGIKVTKRRMQGTFQLLGGPGDEVLPFVVSGPTYGDELNLELIFIEGDENNPMTLWSAVDELDRSGGTLLLQRPDGTQMWVVTGPGASGQDTEEDYNAISGLPTKVYWRRRKLVLTQVSAPSFF